MKTDAEFYELARDFPSAMVTLAARARPRGPYLAASVTLKRTERRIDHVLEPLDPRDRIWVFEYLGYRAPEVERTLVMKGVFLASEIGGWGRIGLAVIYTRKRYARAALPAALGPSSGGDADRAIVRIVLEELAPEDLLALTPELFPLIPFTGIERGEIRARLPGWLRQVARTPGMSKETVALLREDFARLFTARWERITLQEANQIMETAMPFEKTRVGRDIRKMGEEEGERKGIITSIRDTLKVRFGETPDDLQELLGGRDARALRRVFRIALEAEDLREFRRRLRTGSRVSRT